MKKRKRRRLQAEIKESHSGLCMYRVLEIVFIVNGLVFEGYHKGLVKWTISKLVSALGEVGFLVIGSGREVSGQDYQRNF